MTADVLPWAARVACACDDARVRIDRPERMSLLGLMLASVLSRALADPRRRRHASGLCGDIVVRASGMQVTLQFDATGVTITRASPSKRPLATVTGTLTALLDGALGKRRLAHFLRGDLRLRGGPMALWHLLSLLRG